MTTYLDWVAHFKAEMDPMLFKIEDDFNEVEFHDPEVIQSDLHQYYHYYNAMCSRFMALHANYKSLYTRIKSYYRNCVDVYIIDYIATNPKLRQSDVKRYATIHYSELEAAMHSVAALTNYYATAQKQVENYRDMCSRFISLKQSERF